MKGPESVSLATVTEQEKQKTNPVIIERTIAQLRADALGEQTPVDDPSSSMFEKPKDPAVEAIDTKIEALEAKKREGRKLVARMTDTRMIDIAEKSEDAIDAEIAKLESQRQTVLGQKPS